MEKFKKFFRSLSPDDRIVFAGRCRTKGSPTSVGHLTNIANGKVCGEALAIEIERESCGAVRCEDLRPDVDWAYLRGTAPREIGRVGDSVQATTGGITPVCARAQ